MTAFLKQHLSDGMVPGLFVALETLPLTPNGKLDRRALPRPERAGAVEKVLPRNPTEVAIATLWADILQVETVSVHDNFFELGGHSLSATRLNTRLRQQFELDLPLHSIFEHPTVEALAVHIDALRIIVKPPHSPAGHKEIEL
ncbi:MAG: phosphopantetheine-binding protein [Cyanobacteria bacterium P01_F01_bin.4]